MAYKGIILVLLFLTCSAALSAPWGSGAPPDSILTASSLRDSLRYPLRDIKIYGNRITKDKIILHELPVHLGDTLTEEQVRESQQRVYNIGLFNSADVVLWNDTLTRSAIMYIVVSERWYIFPQIILGVKDRGWTDIFTKGSKLYGGLAGVDYNFLGLNEKLYAGGVLGYDPWADLEYDRIALNRDQTLLLDLSLSTSRTLNQSDTLYTQGLSFNEISYNATGQMHWRVNQRLTVSGTAGFQSLHLSNPNARLTLNPSGNDNSPLVSVSIAYDSRDVVEYPMFGTWFQMSLSRTGFDQYIHYENFSIDLRRYIPTWWGISFCFRAATTLSYDGTDPVYNHVFLGLNERVRGDFFTKREGEDLAIGSAEIRIPLLAPRIYKWSTAPRYLPEQFTIWKFGIYATLFADAGVPWFRDQRLADQQWSNGAGAGIDLLFPYGIVTRFEYAIGTVKGQFIFDVGASF